MADPTPTFKYTFLGIRLAKGTAGQVTCPLLKIAYLPKSGHSAFYCHNAGKRSNSTN